MNKAESAGVRERKGARHVRFSIPEGEAQRPQYRRASVVVTSPASKSFYAVLWIHVFFALSNRFFYAYRHPIQDCDETFNFWEPLHYYLFGYGFKTWEYHSDYALRPWLNIYLHSVLPRFVAFPLICGADRACVFFMSRFVLGVVTTLCEVVLLYAVFKATQRKLVIFVASIMLAFSPGMAHAAISFLPSTFCMWMTALLTAGILLDNLLLILAPAAVSILFAWPFSALICAPAALYVLLRFPLLKAILFSVALSISIVVAVMVADSRGYHSSQWMFSTWNIVLYNVVRASSSELYGVEPADYYFKNLALNWHIAFAASLMAPVILGSTRKTILLLGLSPYYVWLTFHSRVPHKEERFMVPIYPLLAVAAAVSISSVMSISMLRRLRTLMVLLFAITFILLSISRTTAMIRGYGAPLQIYPKLRSLPIRRTACVAGEWYRFPTHFLLPPGIKMQFLRSDFRGELPAHFSDRAAHFNDNNEEEQDRYVDPQQCDVVIVLGSETDYAGWSKTHPKVIASHKFIEQGHCASFWKRAFWMPFLKAEDCPETEYRVLGKR